jgi:alkyl sulfatase BDS1-like metallo-beta-lactamase superfamily hydrolase
VAWVFPDTGGSVALQVRRGVAVVHDAVPDDVDATLTIDAAAVRSLSKDLADADAVLAKAAAVTDADLVRRFLGWFDPAPTTPVKLLVR